ncbi:NUDIX hydrolase [Polaromonas glacialis]|uniref:NUDIX hydrolase n=1 Tax=Polaromonas glacialis TaxID=866564 RepID=UPI000495D26F|nr:NUDIX domain-containing protein [Polaromonas glacialis]
MTDPSDSPARRTAYAARVKDIERPLVTVDVVIFTLIADALQVLLVQRPSGAREPFPGQWALPGGFVDVAHDEDLRACALRKLRDKTAVESPYLEQLGSWGGRTRDPRGWSVTQVYFALLPWASLQPRKGSNAADVRWFPVDAANAAQTADGLAFDHGLILAAAVERLRSKVEYTSLPAFLLTEPFTLPQLQQVYEIVLRRPLDKSAFRTRALAAPDFLEEAGLQATGAPRAPMGYRLVKHLQPVTFPRTFQSRG